jgi:hypothetical protein
LRVVHTDNVYGVSGHHCVLTGGIGMITLYRSRPAMMPTQ